jgi:ParB family transcriptional regulator, chromosome partitioning protein
MLVGEPNAEELADEIVARHLNVRQVEAMARERAQKSGKKHANGKARPSAGTNADALALEKRLSDALGLSVSIKQRAGSGVLSIRFRNLDQLDELQRRLEKRH